MLVYLIVIYFGGSILTTIGFVLIGAGTGGPVSSGNPALLVLGIVFLAVGNVVLVVGSFGILYKVIADGVATGVDNSSTAKAILENAATARSDLEDGE